MNMKAERILIFNVNWLGDVLFSTATIRNIRNNYPDSFIACVVPARCYQVLKGSPHLDEIIIFDEKDRHKGPMAQLNFVSLLRLKKFDLVFLLHRSFTRALLCRLAGIPERIGYNAKRRGFLLTQKIPQPKPPSLHRIDYYLNIIEKAGLRAVDRYTEFFISPEDEGFIDNFLKEKGARPDRPLVVLNPGGNWPPKRWPKDHWVGLAGRLIKELGADVVISGSHNDLPLASSIAGMMQEKPILACGALNLKQLAALAKKCALFISADSGPLHIANAIRARRIIALFGPTSPAITGPYPAGSVIILRKDVGCSIPCYISDCSDNRCMQAITVEDVMEKVRMII